MRVLPALRVVLCAEHGGCYTLATVTHHLQKRHHLVHRQRTRVLDALRSAKLAVSADEVITPANGSAAISGLPVHEGHQCRRCGFYSVNRDSIRQHCACAHRQKVPKPKGPQLQGKEGHDAAVAAGQPTNPPLLPFRPAQLQTLWTEKKQI